MKVAFVTGGTSAIGSAIVHTLVNAGHRVHFQYHRNGEEASELRRATGAIGHQIDFLSDWAPPIENCDIFVHNAAINLSGGSSLDLKESELEDTMKVNVLVSATLARAFSAHMMHHRWGRIVNINSIFGLRAGLNRASYSISKFGLRALTQSLSVELAAFGVTVNEVCAGPVNTTMLQSMASIAVSQGRFRDTESYLASVGSGLPIRRLITPQEVAEAVRYLTSDLASCCAGSSLVIDGGLSACWP
ncbi:SDR family NAD(P)-dependent oxidoreductase [Rhodopseudomonas telluris]|uniref:SDR family NAD(P)-dependent oxidoreductase n=1 Tax=Rhodopseudomonas telluris TaxID=644215 RepID=A0ABV6EWL2_9BRAD